ncbi:SAM-dependent methyltransferase [bacterium]|nr:SAM-dependent methyltransferase [bacterium]
MKETKGKIKSSFRDPSGYLFEKNGILYRGIAESYKEHYEYAKKCGFFEELIKDGHLISHKEVDSNIADRDVYKVIEPKRIPFISYPYEWCFSELKDAALLTLKIQKKALQSGMTLKDASAYNIQFLDGKPILIDTLSFEKYEEGAPWIGYRQFCEHFLAPLVLMSYKDVRLNTLMRIFIDGIPLKLASELLPRRTLLKPSTAFHIHLHAKSQEKFSKKEQKTTWRISKHKLTALLDSLEKAVQKTKIKKQSTEWADYYEDTNYSSDSFKEKESIISDFIKKTSSKTAWDLGANTGEFSRLASEKEIKTVSFDIDPIAVEKNYLTVKRKKEKNLLPLVLDLTNPSPDIGWNNEERMSFSRRGPVDLVLALALIHHIAISNNTPLSMVAESLSKLCTHLIIEFIPKSDSQVKRLLKTREDIFLNYNEKAFEKEFSRYFTISVKKGISGSERSLYLMIKKKS